MSNELLVTAEGAAQRLSIGRSRVFQLLKTGELESLLLGRSRRIELSALKAYVERLRAEQAAELDTDSGDDDGDSQPA